MGFMRLDQDVPPKLVVAHQLEPIQEANRNGVGQAQMLGRLAASFRVGGLRRIPGFV